MDKYNQFTILLLLTAMAPLSAFANDGDADDWSDETAIFELVNPIEPEPIPLVRRKTTVCEALVQPSANAQASQTSGTSSPATPAAPAASLEEMAAIESWALHHLVYHLEEITDVIALASEHDVSIYLVGETYKFLRSEVQKAIKETFISLPVGGNSIEDVRNNFMSRIASKTWAAQDPSATPTLRSLIDFTQYPDFPIEIAVSLERHEIETFEDMIIDVAPITAPSPWRLHPINEYSRDAVHRKLKLDEIMTEDLTKPLYDRQGFSPLSVVQMNTTTHAIQVSDHDIRQEIQSYFTESPELQTLQKTVRSLGLSAWLGFSTSVHIRLYAERNLSSFEDFDLQQALGLGIHNSDITLRIAGSRNDAQGLAAILNETVSVPLPQGGTARWVVEPLSPSANPETDLDLLSI